MQDEIGVHYRANMLMGVSELTYAAFVPAEQRRLWIRGRLAEPGLILDPQGTGNMGRAWLVEHLDAADPLIMRFAQALPNVTAAVNVGVTANGDVVAYELEPTDTYRELTEITVPDDGVWRTLVVKYEETAFEPGTITFTAGDKTVTGVGTKFTRLASKTGDGLQRGDRIYVASGGNAGVYWMVDSVTSDTELELTANAAANQSGATFRVSGSYQNDVYPATPTAHRNPKTTLELKTGVVLPDPDAYLIIADVMLDSGTSNKIQVLDRRYANIARFLPTGPPRSFSIGRVLSVQAANSSIFTNDYSHQTVTAASQPLLNSADLVYWWAIAPASNGLDMVAVATRNGDLRAVVYDAISGTWPAWDTTPGVRPDTSGIPNTATLEALPAVRGNTHILVYFRIDTGEIHRRFSTDDGATWGTQGTIIAAADYGDENLPALVLLTRAGRLYVFWSWSDGASDGGVRCCYSDDYGDSWETNGGAGYEVFSQTGSLHIPRLKCACETHDGRIAILCNNRVSVSDNGSYSVIFTRSTTNYAWDPGDNIAGSPPTYPPTIRVTDVAGEEGGSVTYGQASLVALPNGDLAIFHTIYDGASAGNARGYVTVVGSQSYTVDSIYTDALTLPIKLHAPINWSASGSTGLSRPQQIYARMMPNGLISATLWRSYPTAHRYDHHLFQVIDAPLTLAPHPSTYADLDP